MRYATLDGRPPADLPIWARLQLIAAGMPFAHVDSWRPERLHDTEVIVVFTVFGGIATVARPDGRTY